MDGNGRWAKNRGLDRLYGHKEGVESVRACMRAAVEDGIEYLSIYAFSEENWNRPEEEVQGLMDLMIMAMKAEIPTFLENSARFIALGNMSRLSELFNRTVKEITDATAAGTKCCMILMVSYSGQWDLLQAMKKAAAQLSEKDFLSLSQEDFGKYLVTAGIPDPDLLIRTSGEVRISNYMLWQTAYTELYFTDILWPDFREEQFREALAEYAKRDRRYGKVK